jgi:predicted TIM-barrel fold metal-dependent hydrolase
MRGGGGVRLKYSNPMYLDDVAVDFPDMPINMAHPSFPWIDLSKYFPPLRNANRRWLEGG